MSTRVLAFDLGASSGRAILGEYDGRALTLREVHRFDNEPMMDNGRLCWNFGALMANLREGIEKAGVFDSVGVDTWGVDYGLLDAQGKLIGRPTHYRDERTVGMVEKVTAQVPAKEIYAQTGCQIMALNTLFQLAAETGRGETLLFMPDLFAYMLSGAKGAERTIASTSQMLSPVTGQWQKELLQKLGIPTDMLPEVTPPGTVRGELKEEYGVPGAKVVAVAGHDTQSAVVAVPFASERAAFLSCGTWSLLGAELDTPILTERSMLDGLSNELGANGKVNYLQNISGLWLLQECRREWKRQGQSFSYAELMRMAGEAEPLRTFVDPDAVEFSVPGDMLKKIDDYCAAHGQPKPRTIGEYVRGIYESLALRYRMGMEKLARATGKTFDTLHFVGGGAQATLLCQMTADALGMPVQAGPLEATALGNILLQLIALGKLADVDAARALVRRVEQVTTYLPQQNNAYDEAYHRFLTLYK